MEYLHLSPPFLPNGVSLGYESFTFSGGEPHIKITDSIIGREVTISVIIRSFNDLGLLLIGVDALRRAGVDTVDLILPYFPGARQDRVMVEGEPLSVRVYAELINGLDFRSVTILDPHSDVAPALINRVRVISNENFIRDCVSDFLPTHLVAPDAGALKKVRKLSEILGGIEVIECSKRRDTTTGALSQFGIASGDPCGARCLVVDDICDGGGTFIGLGEMLQNRGAESLGLAVTHGIFSKGVGHLLALYNSIFTTDSWFDGRYQEVKSIPWHRWLSKGERHHNSEKA